MSTRQEVAIESNPHALSPNLDQVGPGISPASEDRHTESFGAAAHDPDHRAQRGVEGARSAPLDLIEEHLTDKSGGLQFRPGLQSGRLVKNWLFPVDWTGPKDGGTPVLKVQRFESGGYEASVRMLDLKKIGNAMEFGGCRGKREEPSAASAEGLRKSAGRAKRKLRYLVKNMCATHLLTLTRRETETSDYWTPEQWSAGWDRLRRMLVKLIGEFPYVAVLERHEKGNYHLHIAWLGRVNLNVVRPAWWACVGGRGAGNVDAQYIRVAAGRSRADRVARYISKYVTKNVDVDCRFNKKRYWGSRQSLPEVRRYVLDCDRKGMLSMAADVLGIDNLLQFMRTEVNRKMVFSGNLFLFPDDSGFWLNFIPGEHSGAPPPF